MIFWSAQGLFLECLITAIYSTFSGTKNKNFLIPGPLIGKRQLTFEYQLKEPVPQGGTKGRDPLNPASLLAYSPKSTTVPPVPAHLNFFIFFHLLKKLHIRRKAKNAPGPYDTIPYEKGNSSRWAGASVKRHCAKSGHFSGVSLHFISSNGANPCIFFKRRCNEIT